MTQHPHRLSVVVITKNEETKIEEGLKTVLAATDSIPDSEILLVDSASTDSTVEIASRYPIRIVQLSAHNFLSPSSGRHIGTQYTDGEYVFFLDGDMTLDAQWLNEAVSAMDAQPELAGVAGRCEEIVYSEAGRQLIHRTDRFFEDAARAVDHLGGSALYRRAVLEEVGGFNPYLANEEELELGLRIRAAGYELRRIDAAMSLHRTVYYSANTPSGLTWSEIRRDWRTKRNVALGRVLRCVWRNPMRGVYFKLYRRELIMTTFFLSGLLLIPLSLLFAAPSLLIMWGSALAALFALRAVSKRDVKDTLLTLAHHASSAYGFTLGFLTGSTSPSSYEAELVVVQ